MEGGFTIWLAGLPVGLAAAVIVGLGVLLSLTGSFIVHRLYTLQELQANNLVGGSKFSFIGEVYAVTLGLVLIGAWNNYVDARDNIQKEAATLGFLRDAASVYDGPDQLSQQAEMRRAIQLYARAVVEKEWRTMSLGVASPEVSLRFQALVDAFTKVEPVNNRQQALQQNTVEWLREVNEHRSFRLTQISRSLIGLVWLLIGFGTLVAIGFPWYFGTVNPLGQAAMSAVLTAFLMVHILVVLKLAYPFVGETAIQPDPFIRLAQ